MKEKFDGNGKGCAEVRERRRSILQVPEESHPEEQPENHETENDAGAHVRPCPNDRTKKRQISFLAGPLEGIETIEEKGEQ